MKRNLKILTFLSIFLLSIANPSKAQSIKDIFESVLNNIKTLNIEGTWVYQGSSVQFESDNLLKKAGGKLAALKIEQELDTQLSAFGFQSGTTQFVFKSDSTFISTINGKTFKGKYSYNKETGYMTLTYLRIIPVTAKILGQNNTMSLLFQADKFQSFITLLGGISGIQRIKDITDILNSYDGMLVGLKLEKQ